MIGLYIHVPFCARKCDYCDFYSLNYNTDVVKSYVDETCRRILNLNKTFDTVYFGGGTPSIIGAENIEKILSCVTKKDDAEVTLEVNPRSFKGDFFNKIFDAGVNRISIGLQSANDDELKNLSRTHNCQDVASAISLSKQAGFENISLDVMIGIQGQTKQSLENTLKFCVDSGVLHLSCYMLKIEEGTPFSKMKLDLPSDDQVSDMYLFMCDFLKSNGYYHYEVSNFAKNGAESKHNLLYWECEDYIGVGPSAHSMIDKKRYYFPRDIKYYLEKNDMIYSEDGADLYDYIMLGLRLKKGITLSKIAEFDAKSCAKFIDKFKKYDKLGYASFDGETFALNEKGFLVQNSILVDLLEDI